MEYRIGFGTVCRRNRSANCGRHSTKGCAVTKSNAPVASLYPKFGGTPIPVDLPLLVA
jgi:hypothetical protein